MAGKLIPVGLAGILLVTGCNFMEPRNPAQPLPPAERERRCSQALRDVNTWCRARPSGQGARSELRSQGVGQYNCLSARQRLDQACYSK